MNKKILAVAAMMLLMPMMMGAQALKGSYFLDNSLNRNKMNPAFAPTSNYFQIPVVGNFGLGAYTNLTLPAFLYPSKDGSELYTFLHKNVPVQDFEKALPKNPYLDLAADLNVLNFGFRTKIGYFTFDTGVRINADIDIPAELFLFMKKGSGQSGTYNIGSFKANAAANVYAALGFSRDLSDLVPGLRVGGKIRGLVPVAQGGLNLTNVSLSTSPDKWTVQTEGTVHTAFPGLTLAGPDGNLSPSYTFQMPIAGFGMSFDLGAEYKFNLGKLLGFDRFPISSINFSAAFTDLGFISYKKEILQGYQTKGQMDWTGLALSLEQGASSNMMNEVMDDLMSQVENLTKIDQIESGFKPKSSTMPSYYIGAEVELFKIMSFGLLYSSRQSYFAARHEMTLSYNLNPCKWFALGLNTSFLSARKTAGVILEFTPKAGPSLCFGLDYIPYEFARLPEGIMLPFVPTSYRVNLHLGLSMALGGRK